MGGAGRWRTTRGIAGLVLAFALVGCSDQSLRDYLSGEEPIEDKLKNPTVATAKRIDGVDMCALLKRPEVMAAMRRDPLGPPDGSASGLCNWRFPNSLPEGHDSVMVGIAGRMTGEETTIRGNSALITRSGLACTVTIAVAEREQGRTTSDQLSVRYSNENETTERHCDHARELAQLAFDRLPAA